MFPIRDTIPSQRFPVITVLLIAANVAAFGYQLSLPEGQLEQLIVHSGMIPRRYLDLSWARAVDLNGLDYWPFLTSMFLHGGWMHLLSNVWMLWIFGDNVEDRLGPLRYLVFYVAAGLIAGLLHLGTNATSPIPTIGASGAIAGVMGAYFVLFPKSQVLTLIPILIYPLFIQVPAVLYLGFWFVSQVFSGAMTVDGAEAGGVAWWAHVGGFIGGILLLMLLRRPDRTSGGAGGPRRPGGSGPYPGAAALLLALLLASGCRPEVGHWRTQLKSGDRHEGFLAALAIASEQPRRIGAGLHLLVRTTDDELALNRAGARRGLALIEARRPELLMEYLIVEGPFSPAAVRELLPVFERGTAELERATLDLARDYDWALPDALAEGLAATLARQPDWRRELEALHAETSAPGLGRLLAAVEGSP